MTPEKKLGRAKPLPERIINISDIITSIDTLLAGVGHYNSETKPDKKAQYLTAISASWKRNSESIIAYAESLKQTTKRDTTEQENLNKVIKIIEAMLAIKMLSHADIVKLQDAGIVTLEGTLRSEYGSRT